MPVILTEGKTLLRLELSIELTARKELFDNPDDASKVYLGKYLAGFQRAEARLACIEYLGDLTKSFFSAFKPGQKIHYQEVKNFIVNNTTPGYAANNIRLTAQSADSKHQQANTPGQFIRTRSVETIAPTLIVKFNTVTT